MNLQEKEDFIMLTRLALSEEETGKFVGYLMKRDPYISRLLKIDPHLFGDEMEDCLAWERELLERLEKERMVIIKKMDALSQNKRAVRKYSAKFPLPPMPTFLNQKG
jgi:hypothetical protein